MSNISIPDISDRAISYITTLAACTLITTITFPYEGLGFYFAPAIVRFWVLMFLATVLLTQLTVMG